MVTASGTERRSHPHLLAAGIALALLVVWLAAMTVAINHAALPPDATGRMIAVFPPGLSNEAMVEKIAAAGGKPLRQTWASSVWVIDGDEPGLAGRLKQHGALSTYAELPVGVQMAGCFAWADTRVDQLLARN
jgi:hypothetical protein